MADDCAVVFEPDYLASCGSSLLVTALLPLILVVYGSSGNAPTPVGYTLKIKQSLGYVKDHPHTCGEYIKENLLYRHSHFSNTAILITLLLSAGRHGCLTNKPAPINIAETDTKPTDLRLNVIAITYDS